jgi:PAS domain-containing protein
VNGVVNGVPDGASEVDAMVHAVGSVLGWDAADFFGPAGGDVPARQWSSPTATTHEAHEAHEAHCPEPVSRLAEESRQLRRVLWRTSPEGGGAVAVPVRHHGVVVGALAFHGGRLSPPEGATTELLEAVAGMLGRTVEVSAPRVEPAGAPEAAVEDTNGPHTAMALVDVFAFTVQVEDGAPQWRYFGPNSAAVFGRTVGRSEALSSLIRRHADPDDAETVEAFLDAVMHGRRCEVELRLRGKDDTIRWVSWRAVPRTVGGRLLVDGVATDVTARHSLGRSRRELAEARMQYSQEVDVRREHAKAVRDANDNVLQRLFAAGLRLRSLQRRLDDTEAHAASAIAFQLDQAVSDLRELILNLNGVIDRSVPTEPAPDDELDELDGELDAALDGAEV